MSDNKETIACVSTTINFVCWAPICLFVTRNVLIIPANYMQNIHYHLYVEEDPSGFSDKLITVFSFWTYLDCPCCYLQSKLVSRKLVSQRCSANWKVDVQILLTSYYSPFFFRQQFSETLITIILIYKLLSLIKYTVYCAMFHYVTALKNQSFIGIYSTEQWRQTGCIQPKERI